jgi:hypothetical protein
LRQEDHKLEVSLGNMANLIPSPPLKKDHPIKKLFKDLNGQLTKENIQMTNKQMKRLSTTCITKELH